MNNECVTSASQLLARLQPQYRGLVARLLRRDMSAPPRLYSLSDVVVEVHRVNRRYSRGTIKRILQYDLVIRNTSNHVVLLVVERDGFNFRRLFPRP